MLKHPTEHDAQAYAPSMMLKQCLARATNERTNLRKNHSPCLETLALSNARRGAQDLSQSGVKNA